MIDKFCNEQLSGQVRVQTDLARFTLVGKNWHLGPRRIDEFLFYLICSGSCGVKTGSRTFKLRAGDLLWIPPGTEHECRVFPNEPMALHHLRFRIWSGRTEVTDLGGVHYVRDAEEIRPWVIAWIKELEDDGPWQSIRIPALLTLIATRVLEIESRSDTAERSFTRQQCEVIERFADTHIDLRLTAHDLAAELEISTTYFRQLFRHTYGRSVRSWLVRHRIRQAAVMLTEAELTISATAYALGYESLSLFSRQFGDVYTMSPRAYKKSRK